MAEVGYAVGDQILSDSKFKGHSFSAVVSGVDTTDNCLTVPNHVGFDLTSGDFTVETWIYMPFSILDAVLCTTKPSTENSGWTFKVLGNRKLAFQMFGSTNYIFSSIRKIVVNKWTHVAVTLSGNTIRLFVDGVESSRDTVSPGITSSEDLKIGLNHSQNDSFVGNMSEFRITKGIARYTESFAPPSVEFDGSDPLFASVSLLLKFNGLNNSTVFDDSSSYAHSVVGTGSIYITNSISLFGNTCGYFSGLGAISKVNIYNHGYEYDQLPDIIIQSTFGSNANLLPSSNNIGQIESIEIIDPFIDSYDDPVATVISENGTGAILTAKVVSVFKEKPSWKTMEGMLGLNSTLLDSDYYQQFSYYTYSAIPRKESDEIGRAHV
jgi:hypothetical protein